MRSVLLIAALLVAGPAVAQDATRTPVTFLPSTFNWSGVYVGINAGRGWASNRFRNLTNTTPYGDALPGATFAYELDGALAGVQAGVNRQFGPLLLGVEAQFELGGVSGNLDTAFGVIDDRFTTKVTSMTLVTGRAGVAFNNFLIYGKAGYAGSNVRVTITDTVGPFLGQAKATSWRHGYDLGGGIEVAVLRDWTAALEYNYVTVGGARYELAGNNPGTYAWRVSLPDVQFVTLKLNYQWNR